MREIVKTAFLIFCLIMPALAQWDEENIPITRDELRRRAEDKYLRGQRDDTYRYYNDTVVDRDNLVGGNVVVDRGDLEIFGEVEGDVLVIMGNVTVRRHAVVSGNITCIGGRISQHENSIVTGNQIETSERNIFRQVRYRYEYDYDYHYNSRSYRDQYSTLPMGPLSDRFMFRYNRVQGVFLGLEFPKSIVGKYNVLNLHGFAGYGFQEKRLRYELGIDRYLFSQRDYRTEIGASVYDLTDTRDNWLITPLENTLAAIMIHEDFQDFYRRRGFEVHASQNITIFLKGTLAYRNDDYESLNNNTEWAIFGGDKKFRLNPAVDEGNMRSLVGQFYLDTRNDHKWPRSGWYGKLSMEYSNSSINSDFSFNQYLFEVRHYMPVSRGERLDFRFKVGSAEGILPFQKLFELGGISTLRGFSYKEFSGDRMLLANVEYNISPSTFSRDILFFDDLRLILFTDVGRAWYSDDSGSLWNGFNQVKWNNLKSNFGFAISDWKGHFRLNIAKRTDTNRKPVEITFRIAKPF